MTASQVNGQRVPLAVPVFGEVWPVTPPQSVAQAEADRAEAAALLAKANETHEKASKDADRARGTAEAELDRARAEAQRIRDEAAAETDQKKKTAAQLDVWAARVVIAGAVGLTASGEYSLALMVGFAPLSAWLLPLVIDVYVIQAFRRHRDILQAIGLTIAANVIYHLAAVGLFGLTPKGKPEWWLIAVVASIASLILWRMHLMIAPPRERHESRRERRPVHARESRSESAVALSPSLPDESRDTSHETPVESAGESAPQTPRESTLTEPAPQPQRRESKPKAKPKQRETKPKASTSHGVSPIGDIEREILALVALMGDRGGAEEVKLSDAKRITASDSEATAARRLSAARAQYRRKTA